MKKVILIYILAILIVVFSACSSNTAQAAGSTGTTQVDTSAGIIMASSVLQDAGITDVDLQTTAVPDEDSEDEVATQIVLGATIAILGEGATANGNVVNITAGGTYRISGTLTEGQVDVNTTEKVKLQLDNVSITNSTGPALMITDAKKITLKLIKGTINTLSDAPNISENDAALFTNDTLVIKGEGTLIVNGNNQEGISSDDDIIIENGILRVTARDDGLNAHDDITVLGGTLIVEAGGDALDSNGTTNIAGGTTYAMGSMAGGDGGLDSMNTFLITGGTLIATGNTSAAPDSTSTQASVYLNFAANQAAGTLFNLSQNGTSLLTYAPNKDYMTVLFSSPDLVVGETYQANAGGSSNGTSTDGLYLDGTYTSGATTIEVVAALVPAGAGQMGGPGGGGPGGGPGGLPGQRPAGGMQPPTPAQ